MSATIRLIPTERVFVSPGPLARMTPNLKQQIADELRARDAVLVAHYYVAGDLQDLALETGGCVADSLEMASAPQLPGIVSTIRETAQEQA